MIVSDYLITSASSFPFKTAIITETERIDYLGLLDKTLKFSSAAKSSGLSKGDRVLIYTDNSIGYVVSYFGILCAGGVVVGQSTGNKERHIKNVINHCQATGIVTSGRHLKTVLN
ncbi:MAG: acyl--CoA ligase, partial [candidate division Zixibacteria bacterium]|nr:acyl--CoA ligase [candidate division Zixibacteria bacterium]